MTYVFLSKGTLKMWFNSNIWVIFTQGVFHFERTKKHDRGKSDIGTVLAVASIVKLLDLS